MRLLWELSRLSFQRQLTYRTANLAGLATNLFFGYLRAILMIALYGSQQTVAGISLAGAIIYTGMTQAIIAYLSIFGWYDLMNTISSGDVAADLLKPMGFFRFWLAKDIGRAFSNLLLRGLPIMIAYALIFHISVPTTFEQWFFLGCSLIQSGLVSFAYRFLVNLAAFWTPNALGIGRFAFGIVWITSGFIMPLRFYPNWVMNLCQLTPFPSLVNTPVEVYLGVLQGNALFQALGMQLFWFLFLVATGQIVLRAGVRSLVIQGG